MFFRYLLDMLQLVLSPKRGWEDIAVDDIPANRLLTGGFIPLIIVNALSCLTGFLYHDDISTLAIVASMISSVVMFLVPYFLASFFFSLYIPSCTGGTMRMNKNHTFIIYSLSIMVVMDILIHLLPMVPDMIFLLPIYVLFIMWRGLAYMEVKFDGVISFLVLNILTVLLPPFIFNYLFKLILS